MRSNIADYYVIYEKKKINTCIANSKYYAVLNSLDVDFYLIKYEKGELVSSKADCPIPFKVPSLHLYFI